MTSFGGTKESALEALQAECGLIADVVTGLSEPDFARPTRCPPWDVKVLLGHLWGDVDRIVEYGAQPEAEAADADAVSYWRSYDPVGDAPLVSARSVNIAERFPTGQELALSFEEHARSCLKAGREMDAERILRTRVTRIRLDEFLGTRVLEAAVHGLDLAAALDRPPWITRGGIRVTINVLRGLMDGEPPGELEWDEIAFIEFGTGRRALSDTERRALGSAAALFPLLS